MNEKELSREHILNEVRNSSHNKIKVAITDIDGVLRGKLMRKDKFLSAVEGGFGFCDVVFGGCCRAALTTALPAAPCWRSQRRLVYAAVLAAA